MTGKKAIGSAAGRQQGTQRAQHLLGPRSKRAKRLRGHRQAGLRGKALGVQALQQVSDVVGVQYRVGDRDRRGAGKGLIAARRQFADQRAVRAGAHEDEMPWRALTRIDRVACGLQCKQHLVAVVGGDGVLDLVDDQHDVAVRLIHDLGECLGQRRAAFGAHAVDLEAELEAELEAGHRELGIAQPLQPLGGGGWEARAHPSAPMGFPPLRN
jgi:hypothetical protein